MRPAALRATQRVLIGSDWFDVHWIWRHRLPTALARRAADPDASADGHALWPLLQRLNARGQRRHSTGLLGWPSGPRD